MTGCNVKKYVTVVMDASNKEVLNDIVDWIDRITEKRHGVSMHRPLGTRHSIEVIETYTIEERYNDIERTLEEKYPGLCVFNPVTTV